LQLTDSISSTSTTTAATPNAVKSANDNALIKGTNVTRTVGYWYRTPVNQFTGTPITHQVLYYTPIFISQTTTLDRLAIFTGATFSGSSTVRVGIYNDTNGQPSTLLLDAGTVAPVAASAGYTITINQTLSTGFYWLAFCQQGTAPTASIYGGAASSTSQGGNLLFAATTVNGTLITGFNQTGVTGAFANAGTIAVSGSTPYVWFRRS
jgi:hypothetical protein